jgi:hypothetical protein
MHFTANQLAACNIFYNSPSTGITLPELATRMGRTEQGEIGGILSKLAQEIDLLENPGQGFGFTGYLLFFERFNGDLHKLRPEFRHVIDQHPILRNAMQMTVEQIYRVHQDGLNIH